MPPHWPHCEVEHVCKSLRAGDWSVLTSAAYVHLGVVQSCVDAVINICRQAVPNLRPAYCPAWQTGGAETANTGEGGQVRVFEHNTVYLRSTVGTP